MAAAEMVSAAVLEAAGSTPTRARGVIARGLGRGYGDAAGNGGGLVLDCTPLQHIGEPDHEGHVTVGAGVSVGRLIDEMLPKGWFVPVVPGTRHVSMGGALAADVHGKNHHRDGSIGRHVLSLQVVDGTGRVRELKPADPAFGSVIGGLGLSCVITSVTLRMRPVESAGILVRTLRTTDLDDTMNALAEADAADPYSVAWLDTLARGRHAGRGVLTSGDHAPAALAGELPSTHAAPREIPAPPWAPSGLLRRSSVRAFNEAYYRAAPRLPREDVHDVTSFFHPLDRVGGWNRLYGRRGFVQHQFAVADGDVVRRILDLYRRSGAPAFLAVLKRFGPGGDAPLSFPIPGWTLAVDLPVVSDLGPFLDRVDRLVADAGGRVYLVKDSRLDPSLLPVMYPQVHRWRDLRDDMDPRGVFRSDLARRLNLC